MKHAVPLRVVAALLALLALPGRAEAAAPEPLADFAQRWAEQSDFSGSLRLERNGQLLASVQRGHADPDASMPIQADTAFWIGSVSKQFAAVATLLLAERGQLDLQAPLTNYLPEVAVDTLTRDGVRCSIEHVLSHSCGLPRDLGFDPLPTARHLQSTRRARRLFEQVNRVTLSFVPGTEYQYSNVGYDLIGLLVQKVAGRPYEQLLEQELWQPLGMSHTGIAPRPGIVPARGQLSVGFAWLDAARWLLFDPASPAQLGASGNVYSTPADLSRFNHALHHGLILKPASYQAMLQPRHGNYGLGIAMSDKAFGKTYNHVGSHSPQSTSAILIYVPGYDLELAAVANRVAEASGLKELADGLLAEATGTSTQVSPGPPSGLQRAISFSPLATLWLIGLLASAQLWSCFKRREKFGRWRWWLCYHVASLALASFLLRWRDRSVDPALILWGSALLAGSWRGHWWRLPHWTGGVRRSAAYLDLAVLAALLLLLLLYTPDRIVRVFIAACALEAFCLAAPLARRLSMQPGA